MTDTTPEAVAGMVEKLATYRPRDEWGDGVRHMICDEAAAMLTALSAENVKWAGANARMNDTLAEYRAEIDAIEAERDQARADLAEVERLMKDPVAVHASMLRGSVARLSPSQVWHIYGAALADAMPSDVRKTFLAKHT